MAAEIMPLSGSKNRYTFGVVAESPGRRTRSFYSSRAVTFAYLSKIAAVWSRIERIGRAGNVITRKEKDPMLRTASGNNR